MEYVSVSFDAADVRELVRHTKLDAKVGHEATTALNGERPTKKEPEIWFVMDPAMNQIEMTAKRVGCESYMTGNGRRATAASRSSLLALPLQRKISGWKGLVEQVAKTYDDGENGAACFYSVEIQDLEQCLDAETKFLVVDIFPRHIQFWGVGKVLASWMGRQDGRGANRKEGREGTEGKTP